ncbi:MAG: DNA cytosine methyltransferase [Aquabacterium sp.]|jgi:DNA (cytosine-5)-methyltransferase 1|uniref:DNA cytosine methyltransferase n=1 Tax=Aquabacterium sp. TaxID=1872578 RepID=UPI001B76ADE5|nr:DNA cytosine methyltransferase [Aquabacterium sp.]MBP7131885.1 DNA cytosine methyltransferase [Aquabacterium sp.]
MATGTHGNFYEFFAGGGMARAGLGDDWRCRFANDISAKKGDAYRTNWGDDDLWIGDVFKVTTDQLAGHADLAWGSFPCQDLSLAGNGEGLSGDRSGAFWGFWRIIKALNREGRKPRIVVLENVYGTLTSHDGRDFEQIVKAVAAEGYVFGALVMDAVHFVPQSRPRLFVVGIDADLVVPESIHTPLPTPAWHPDAVIRAYSRLPKAMRTSWRWWNPPAPGQRIASLDLIVEQEPQGVIWHTPEHTQNLLAMMSEVNRRKVMEAQRFGAVKVGTIYRRTRDGVQRAEVRFDGIAGCLRTPAGGSSRQTIMVVDGPLIRSRLISPREMARLMGLPETYQLPDRYNDAYHLLGDGVAVPVVAHLRQHILTPIVQANSMAVSGIESAARRCGA